MITSMISETTLLVLGGCLLGAIQLFAGVAIGLWLRRADTGRSNHDMLEAGLIAERLKSLADQMSTSAHEHRGQLDRASRLLTADELGGSGEATEVVVNVIGDIIRANQNLQAQLETAESRLEVQAVEIEAHISRSLTDPLTGLPNRREFNQRLEERMSAWHRRREPFALLMIDVDHFKNLNDRHGHLVGDQVLATVARTIRGAVRVEDAVARYGGEEFAVLLPSITLDQAAIVAEKIREMISRTVIEHDAQSIHVTISGGLAAIVTGDTAESIIQKADEALYAAKASGRNRTCIHHGTGAGSTSPAARLVELIRSADVDPKSGTPADNFAAFLPREAISTDLAKKCDELRRRIEQRNQQRPEPTVVAHP